MLTSARSVLLLLVPPFLVVLASRENVECQGQFCQLASGVVDSPAITSRANSCPATDCDGTGVLEHHLGEEDNAGGSLVCLDGTPQNNTNQNAFIRCFEGSSCSQVRTIDSVTFHVRSLTVDNYVATVNLYKGPLIDCSDLASVRGIYQTGLVASETSQVMNTDSNFLVDVPMTSTVLLEPDESLVVEVDAPTLAGRGRFVLGDSSDPDQCSPSYLQNDICGGTNLPINVAVPRPANNFPGFPLISYVISVQTSPVVTISPKPTPSQEPSSFPTTSAPVLPTPAPTPLPPLDIGSCFVSVVAVIYCIIGLFFPSFRL